MLKGKINLSSLIKTAIVTGNSGQKLLYIDIDESRLFYSEKTGAVYLDFVGWESKQDFADFSLKQSFNKEQNEADKAQDIKRPYIGNMKDDSKKPASTLPPKVQDVLDADGFSTDSSLPF